MKKFQISFQSSYVMLNLVQYTLLRTFGQKQNHALNLKSYETIDCHQYGNRMVSELPELPVYPLIH